MTEITKNPLADKSEKFATELSTLGKRPKSPDETNTAIKKVIFTDGSIFYLPAKIVDKYKALQSDVIFASSQLFTMYILPIIFEERLIGKQFDEEIELDMICAEISKYGIQLTNSQEYDLACCAGLIALINTVADYINRHEAKSKLFSKKYMERVNKFGNMWDEYIRLMKIHYPSRDYYDKLNAISLVGTIKDPNNINAFIHLNFKYDNNIFQFCKYFKLCVIEKKPEEFSALTLKLKVDIGGGIFDGITSIVDTVSKAIDGLTTFVPTNIKDALLSKVEQITNIDSLLKGK